MSKGTFLRTEEEARDYIEKSIKPYIGYNFSEDISFTYDVRKAYIIRVNAEYQGRSITIDLVDKDDYYVGPSTASGVNSWWVSLIHRGISHLVDNMLFKFLNHPGLM